MKIKTQILFRDNQGFFDYSFIDSLWKGTPMASCTYESDTSGNQGTVEGNVLLCKL